MATPVLLREPAELPRNRLLGSLVPTLRDPLGLHMRAFEKDGSVVHTSIGPPGMRVDVVAFYDPEAIAHILDSPTYLNYRRDTGFYRELALLFGDGLLTAQDDTWKRQRRLVQPLFTARAVDTYAEVIVDESRRLVDRWHRDRTDVIDPHQEMTELTLRVITRVLVGEDAHDMIPVMRSAVAVLGRAVLRRGSLGTAPPLSWPVPGHRRLRAEQRALFDMCDQVIARRRARAEAGDDLVGRLISARDEYGDSLSNNEIRDQLVVFLGAGYETTATSLIFALWLLGHNRDSQQRVRDEAGMLEERPSAADLHGLEYTTMTVKEAMRLYPSAPIQGKIAAADDVIDGYRVRRGQFVLTAPWVTHRRADLWADPLTFDPLRFIPERMADRHRLAWVPFSHGPRSCIGQRLAMLEAVGALAIIVADFDIRSTSVEPRLGVDITLQLREPIRCQISPVTR